MLASRFVLSSDEVRQLEHQLLAAGFSELAMMESVAAGIAWRLRDRLAEFSSLLVLAGPGNNGADGCAVLRCLLNHGWSGPSALVAWPGPRSPARETQERLLMAAPGEVIERWPLSPETLRELRDNKRFAGPTLVIDALFGAGFRARAMAPASVDFLTGFGAWARRTRSEIVAIDVPSGLDDQGHVAPEFHPLRAAITFSVAGPRLAQLENEGADQSGRIECVDLGLRPRTGQVAWVGRRRREIAHVAATLDFDVRRPAKGAHKNARGRVAVVGGSLAGGGATRLAAESALRFGAGYATLFESAPLKDRAEDLTRGAGEWVLRRWPSKSAEWKAALGEHEVLVWGCGLPAGGVPAAELPPWKPFFRALTAVLAGQTKCHALVIDGGGLVTFLKFLPSLPQPRIPCILTPHPKEAADMLAALGCAVPASRRETFASLRGRLAARGLRGALLLKGAYPWLATIEGIEPPLVLDLASPRLATAGSGDTLAGAVAGASLVIRDARVALLAACAAQLRAVKRVRTGALASEIGVAMGECWQKEIRDAFRV